MTRIYKGDADGNPVDVTAEVTGSKLTVLDPDIAKAMSEGLGVVKVPLRPALAHMFAQLEHETGPVKAYGTTGHGETKYVDIGDVRYAFDEAEELPAIVGMDFSALEDRFLGSYPESEPGIYRTGYGTGLTPWKQTSKRRAFAKAVNKRRAANKAARKARAKAR